MARINLLPWRADRRKQRKKEFLKTLAAAVLGGAAVVMLTSFYFDAEISGQTSRNDFLKAQIAKVELQIKEIEGLEARRASLLQRKDVIENLQADRSQNVRLFEELVRTIPDGVRLLTIKQNGAELTINGRSQSNARVSAYMRNLETSGLITNPQLKVIEERGEDRALPFEFEMKVTLQPVRAEHEGSDEPSAVAPATAA